LNHTSNGIVDGSEDAKSTEGTAHKTALAEDGKEMLQQK
jgi:hypothetical protein